MRRNRAIKELEKRIRKDPESPVTRLKLAAEYRKVGRTKDAARLYGSVAVVYHEQGRRSQAMAVCKSVLEIDPTLRETRALLAQLEQSSVGNPVSPPGLVSAVTPTQAAETRIESPRKQSVQAPRDCGAPKNLLHAERRQRMEKLARIHDAEVLPVWTERFARMLLRGLSVGPRSQVLVVACGTGYPAVEILRRMGDTSRLIAIDESSAMLDVTRKKVEEMGRDGVFFRTNSAAPRLSFADDVYDLVACNLGIAEMPDIESALADFARVTAPNGEVRCTLPIEGTFGEFYDIYREVLLKHNKLDTLERVDEHVRVHPSVADCEKWLVSSGLQDTRVEVESFKILFKSSREFFFAPVIEYGPLAAWKYIAGETQETQLVFWYIKEAIDEYFGGRAFEVTVNAACLIGRKADAHEEVLLIEDCGRLGLQCTPEIDDVPQVIEDDMPLETIEEIERGSGSSRGVAVFVAPPT